MFRFWNNVAPEQSSLVHSACVRVDGWMTSLAVCLRGEIRIHEGTLRVLCPTPACGDGAAGCMPVPAGAGYDRVPAGSTKVSHEFSSGGFPSLFFGKLERT